MRRPRLGRGARRRGRRRVPLPRRAPATRGLLLNSANKLPQHAGKSIKFGGRASPGVGVNTVAAPRGREQGFRSGLVRLHFRAAVAVLTRGTTRQPRRKAVQCNLATSSITILISIAGTGATDECGAAVILKTGSKFQSKSGETVARQTGARPGISIKLFEVAPRRLNDFRRPDRRS